MDSKLFQNLIPEEDTYLFDLHVSASIGCEESVRDIMENTDDKLIINKQNRSGWTPLMYAACSTNLKVILFLLEETALTDLKNNSGQTALILASKSGITDAVSLLIDFRANVNIKDDKGWSAIFYASAFGHRSVVQLLIEKGAKVDVVDKTDGFSPLMLSSAAGHEMIVKDLLQLGANPTLESKTGDTARSLALKHGHQNVKTLLDSYLNSRKMCSSATLKYPTTVLQTDLQTLLKNLQLSKYYSIFEKQGIDLNTFCMLTDEDLKEMGINLLGPRKRMCLAISKYQSNFTKCSSEDKDLLNKFALENKQLEKQIEKLEKELTWEIELRKMAEKNLNDGIITLKNFSGNIQHTMRYTLTLGEKLRQNHGNLKKLLFCAPDINTEIFKRDIVFPLMDSSEKLMDDINHHVLLSIQQTDFRA